MTQVPKPSDVLGFIGALVQTIPPPKFNQSEAEPTDEAQIGVTHIVTVGYKPKEPGNG